ncbi:hypothetical protein BCR42DRAFT_340275 [Absidia repens]|uniref:Eukaryotic translation initiation factor 3 subunit A n=1 Tax=Absidia repens TaxID=90262 RepID=A0A1X2J0H1_9FUNG|nr:hypothetical protein BCR42DRAFT_340275 [Absidia repens]
MAPYYAVKPDSALKRADELIALGQEAPALQALNEVILSKRSRSNPLTVMEPMMLKYVELCVNLRQGKTVKEGLHQYRNLAQNTSVNSIEIVITKLLELSEQKVAEARAKADQIAVDVDDLEASETPESIMLSTVSGEQSKDRTDRAVVTPWLKFLWEVYRTVLDILRNNARLETLYHQVSSKALSFCLTYSRKTEFRRLCEILRNHFQNVSKYSHQPHSINLNDPDTLQQYLNVRFNQLNAAADMELWQEAFKSVEDIYTLLTSSKRPPQPEMLANYYNKLTQIFMVSDDFLFHSAAWNKYSGIERVINKSMSEEDQSRMASVVLLSALAIPIITTTKTRPGYQEADDHRIQKHNRLSMLMGLSQHPTRTGLLKEALNKNILSRVRPEIRDLYNILEVQFHPLSICKKINPIMVKLSEDPDMAKYVRPLHQVILTRLLQQLSQVYTTVKLDFVLELASFPSPYNYDAATIEKFIMNGCKRGELNIRIDHCSQSLTFETDLFAAPKSTVAEGSQLQSSPSDLMRTQLSRLGINLNAALQMIDPSIKDAAKESKAVAVQQALAGMKKEHKQALERMNIIERRKEVIETELALQEKAAAEQKAAAAAKKAEVEKKRMEEELRRREEERLKRVQDEIQRDQAKRIAEEISAKTGLQLKPEEVENSDVKTLLDIKVNRLQTEQKEMSDRLKQIAKRLDHTERAFRKEEIPLLDKDYERQQKQDKAFYEAARKMELATAKETYQHNMQVKTRLGRIFDDYSSYRNKLEGIHQQANEAKRRAADEAIEAEKQERIALWRAKRDELAEIRRMEEERLREQEEAERKAKEEAERKAAEKAAELAKWKQEDEEKRKKLDEMARKQAEREAEIEERRLRQSAPAEPKRGAYVPPAMRARQNDAPSSPSRGAGGFGRSSGGGAYVPPAMRRQAGGGDNDRDGFRDDRRDGDRRSRGGFGGDRDRDTGGSWRR